MKDDAKMTPGQVSQANILTDEIKRAADDVDEAAAALAVAFMRAEDIHRRLLPLLGKRSSRVAPYDSRHAARVIERHWGPAKARCRELICETLGISE